MPVVIILPPIQILTYAESRPHLRIPLLSSSSICTSDLLLVDLKSISILHVKRIWAICGLDATAIEQETDGSGSLALSLAEGIHQFLESRCPLDLEEDFIVVIRDFDIQMLIDSLTFWLLRAAWAAVLVRS